MDEPGVVATIDVGEYCRRVEQHLTRVNAGHLVRIVGPAFSLVREWAEAGVPLSVVVQGINAKAERHRTGRAERPLRLEFCAGDVRAIYADWRRAVGLGRPSGPVGPGDGTGDDDPEAVEARHPSLTKHLDRAADRLARVAGRLELPESFRETVQAVLTEVLALRDQVKGRRGPAREEATREASARLPVLERTMIDAARAAATRDLPQIEADAAQDLVAYRGRLSPEAWQRSLTATVDRFLRDRLGLPLLDVL